MDAVADHAFFMGSLLAEVVHREKPSFRKKPSFDTYIATDCKSLYDSLIRLSSNMQDKRTQIEIASIKEMVSREGVRWVPTTEQHSDPLTKLDRSLEEKMRDWLKDPYCQLRETS